MFPNAAKIVASFTSVNQTFADNDEVNIIWCYFPGDDHKIMCS